MGSGSYLQALGLALCLLPLIVCYTKFLTDYRVSISPIFVAAGMPEGSLLATICIAVMICSYVLGRRRFAPFLKDGGAVLVLGGAGFVAYFVMVGATEAHAAWFGSCFPVIILAESVVYAIAESLLGAVSQRLMVEAAPTKALGSAAYYAVLGTGALLSQLMGTPQRPLLFVLAGIALLSPCLMMVFRKVFPPPNP